MGLISRVSSRTYRYLRYKMPIKLERTLAIIKPDGIAEIDKIRSAIEHSGFFILRERKVQLTSEQVSELFSDQVGKHPWPIFVSHMSSGPIVAIELAGCQAVKRWLTMSGPENPVDARDSNPDSLRALYGSDLVKNALHSSATIQQAQKEIQFFFPETVVEPVLSGDAANDFLQKQVNPTLQRGLTLLCEKKPADPTVWLANWLREHNPNTPQIL